MDHLIGFLFDLLCELPMLLLELVTTDNRGGRVNSAQIARAESLES